MDVFDLRKKLIDDYSEYASSFIQIRDPQIRQLVDDALKIGELWPDALLQLNPTFQAGGSVDELVSAGVLHFQCGGIFRKNKTSEFIGSPLTLHQHQVDAIRVAQSGAHYVLTTGTGSGKSLAYIVPIVDHVIKQGSGRGIQAIIVYPMNALANSQINELRKFLGTSEKERSLVTFERYTGQESEADRQRILENPPDILLTNYVMLELIMTRPRETQLLERADGLRFLVIDELHTYRGRQGADVALLMRRVKERLDRGGLQFVGTSATLSTQGSFKQIQQQVANVASQIFGVQVNPQHVIGETLTRTTQAYDAQDREFNQRLAEATKQASLTSAPTTYQEFCDHPLSRWIESNLGVSSKEEGLSRHEPQSISGEHGAAATLSKVTNLNQMNCERAIRDWLLAGYKCEPHPTTGQKPFAFRLHQFLSPADTVYVTLETEEARYRTLNGQQFAPGNPENLLFPLCFCRECGQEFYAVWLNNQDGTVSPHDFRDTYADEHSDAGYLYLSSESPWPVVLEDALERLPEDWCEERNGTYRIKRSKKDGVPVILSLTPNGTPDPTGIAVAFIRAPFTFCPQCGVTYAPRQGEFTKLASLNSEGRSSATTILSLSAILNLRTSDLPPASRKLLSFTDNRQDASLQAGHFNDFVEMGLLRGAIYRAVNEAGNNGLRHEQITQAVFDALNLPLDLYAIDHTVRFQALQETQRAFRTVLGYRIYRDLKRGWRITSPNLEQCGLVQIDYESLNELCAAEDVWLPLHPSFVSVGTQVRQDIAKTLLDFMRRELAIKVDYLNPRYQEQIRQLSSQRLCDPWAIEEGDGERLDYATVVFPRSASNDSDQSYRYLSPRGGFGIFLRRKFRELDVDLNLVETEQVIRNLFEGLRMAGLVEPVIEAQSKADVPGYQLVAGSMIWRMGSGTRAFHDPIRVPHESESGGRPNPFFIRFYREVASQLAGLEAHEHTAQVPSQERETRESRFREASLPILYCSPTMELGVDIAELNVVHMRNVPPTPANYAQRSGRAGRSGQPALVVTYCAAGSPHDQYFFVRPEGMVAGAVTPPRLDLANEDLLTAHIHAIWLGETKINLGNTLRDILDLSGESPSLTLLPSVRDEAGRESKRNHAYQRASRILSTIAGIRDPETLIATTLQNVMQAFDNACERWRGLYLSALRQSEIQSKIIRDASRSAEDKRQAERLRREAEAQLKLLTEIENFAQSDFYSYRYFATEGFLPGYSFPRLPISAFIPARRTRQREEFIARPRFLAISEFGPRAVIYHEGSRYLINQVMMPVTDTGETAELVTNSIKQCSRCGYVHSEALVNVDLCVRCGHRLDAAITQLLRLQNVVTKRRDRINSDEEERLRLGYEIRSGVQFANRDGAIDAQTALVMIDGEQVAQLTYAQAATIWRINLGWTRRRNRNERGFVLDVERGYWARNEQAPEDPEDPMSPRTRRVIPYVEDKRNCLLIELTTIPDVATMASLQAALKRAIETQYQLEENELAVEPLPDGDTRRLLLFYEAAEGGAGVLRRLIEEPSALSAVARRALTICHFDPESGSDERHAPHAKEDCIAACYRCLLSYSNQREHNLLDRRKIVDGLFALRDAVVESSPTMISRDDHLAKLLRLCESDLEREWLQFVAKHGYLLPEKAQFLIENCQTRPDFLYSKHYAAIYIDGSQHDYPDRHLRDNRQLSCLEDEGFTVIRFGYRDDWHALIRRYAHVFGVRS